MIFVEERILHPKARRIQGHWEDVLSQGMYFERSGRSFPIAYLETVKGREMCTHAHYHPLANSQKWIDLTGER